MSSMFRHTLRDPTEEKFDRSRSFLDTAEYAWLHVMLGIFILVSLSFDQS